MYVQYSSIMFNDTIYDRSERKLYNRGRPCLLRLNRGILDGELIFIQRHFAIGC